MDGQRRVEDDTHGRLGLCDLSTSGLGDLRVRVGMSVDPPTAIGCLADHLPATAVTSIIGIAVSFCRGSHSSERFEVVVGERERGGRDVLFEVSHR